MGSVVLARHRFLGRLAAIKIASRGAPADSESLARIAREAKLLAAVRHPNIVRLYDVADIGHGRLAIVMEYVRGESLAKLIATHGALPLDRCEIVLRDMATALAHAHRCGIVHRDVKPQNVLIQTEAWVSKLCDFGIAKGDAGRDERDVTATGYVVGTPAYMSPEQIDSQPIDGRSDVYSLGIVGWELISGCRPWGGIPLFDVLYHQKHSALPSLEKLRPDAPPRLLLAIEGAIGKSPDDRWATADDMLAQIDSDEPTLALLALRARRDARASATAAARREAAVDGETVVYRRDDATKVSPEQRTLPPVVAEWTVQDAAATLAVRPPESAGAAPAEAPNAPVDVAPVPSVPPDGAFAPRRFRAAYLIGIGGVLGGLLVYAGSAFRTREPPMIVAENSSEESEVFPRSVGSLAAVVVPPAPDPVRATAPAREMSPPPTRETSPPPARATPPSRPPLPASPAPPAPAERSAATGAGTARRPLATLLLERARREARAGRHAAARVAADSGLVLDPRLGELYALRARLRVDRGDVRDAWTDIEMAMRHGALWEVLPLRTRLLAERDGRFAAREQLTGHLREALFPRRMLQPSRALGLARSLLLVDDTVNALTVLDQTRSPDPETLPLLSEPPFDALAGNPRFEELRRRMQGQLRDS